MYIRAHRNPPSEVYSLNGGSTYPISNLYMYLRMYDFVMFTCIGYKLPTFWEYMSEYRYLLSTKWHRYSLRLVTPLAGDLGLTYASTEL